MICNEILSSSGRDIYFSLFRGIAFLVYFYIDLYANDVYSEKQMQSCSLDNNTKETYHSL